MPVSEDSIAEQIGTVAIMSRIISQLTAEATRSPNLLMVSPFSSLRNQMPTKQAAQAPMMDILLKTAVKAHVLGRTVGKMMMTKKSSR